jgi:hypothetical protein
MRELYRGRKVVSKKLDRNCMKRKGLEDGTNEEEREEAVEGEDIEEFERSLVENELDEEVLES